LNDLIGNQTKICFISFGRALIVFSKNWSREKWKVQTNFHCWEWL